MEAPENANVNQDISTFVDFIANLVKEGLEDKHPSRAP